MYNVSYGEELDVMYYKASNITQNIISLCDETASDSVMVSLEKKNARLVCGRSWIWDLIGSNQRFIKSAYVASPLSMQH